MMRAFLCTALALPPTSFRAVDIHNGGVSIFRYESFLHGAAVSCESSHVRHHYLMDAHKGWCISLFKHPAAADARSLACFKAVVALQSQQARGGYADKYEHDFSHAP